MIKANELRIGNYLMDKNGNECIIFHIDSEDDKVRQRVNYIGIDNYEPIPITEEGLLKFGFSVIRDKKTAEVKFYANDRLSISADGKFSAHIFDVNSVYICDLEYIHELQNLNFALTGKELEIK